MKIGRLHIILTKPNESIRKLSWLDNQRVTRLLNGGYHVHKNPRRKLLQNTDPPKIEENE